jgi:hypothetical protein
MENKPQPINTAPTDGTKILAWNGGEWVMAFFDDCWYGDHHSAKFGNYLGEDTLTHWLPQPPKP